jgi:aryl-alcohol dehydrogenase-like predicted oxidoreductase
MKRRQFLKSVAALSVVLPAGIPAAEIASRTLAESEPLLPHRVLGRTGVRVSALALGGVIGMQLPRSEQHDPAAIADTALDLGITYFDTAPSYNNGQSENNYGEVLARRRKEVFLACKTGDRGYDGTLRSVEQSLKRLRTDHLDLLQVHGVTEGDDIPAWGKAAGVWRALEKLRDQRVTRFLGVTGHENAGKLREAIELYPFDTLLTTLNPVSRRRPFREDLLPLAREKRMGILAMKVMGGGNGCLVRGNPFKQVLRPYHDDTSHQVDPADLLRYILGLPISAAIVGVASIAQLRANVRVVREGPPMSAPARRQLESVMA